MNITTINLTKSGMKRLRAELQQLLEFERPDILKRLAAARAHGDLSENAEYHAIKERKAMVNARINELNSTLALAEVFEPTAANSDGRCIFGAIVMLEIGNGDHAGRRREFQLVHPLEASTKEKRLSINSPLGIALLGKQVGNIVDIDAPAGTLEYEIIAISYPG